MTLSEQIKMTPQTILVPASLKYVQGSYEHSVKEIVSYMTDMVVHLLQTVLD